MNQIILLQVHFEEAHDKEDPAFIQNLKDLFGKAKKKILNEDNNQQVLRLEANWSGSIAKEYFLSSKILGAVLGH